MYIKIDFNFNFFCLAMINLSYNIHCWYYINDMIIVCITHIFFVLFVMLRFLKSKATFAILLVHHWKVLDVRVHQGGFTMFRLIWCKSYWVLNNIIIENSRKLKLNLLWKLGRCAIGIIKKRSMSSIVMEMI
jgi:hypothetical protein